MRLIYLVSHFGYTFDFYYCAALCFLIKNKNMDFIIISSYDFFAMRSLLCFLLQIFNDDDDDKVAFCGVIIVHD
jgi:hypothetical protein